MCIYELIFTLHSIVRQYHTWSRLALTAAIFQRLYSQVNPAAAYIDCIRAFGYREDDDARVVNGYRWCRSQNDGEQSLLAMPYSHTAEIM